MSSCVRCYCCVKKIEVTGNDVDKQFLWRGRNKSLIEGALREIVGKGIRTTEEDFFQVVVVVVCKSRGMEK
jgi:hypothetical protein